MSDELLTTAEAARIAGVGMSSLKRWADQNLIRCVRTAGGHRRFHRHDLDAFLREHGEIVAGSPDEWVQNALEAGSFELQGELFRARDRLGSWHAVGDELGRALSEIGARWERGELGVIEEHIASEKLSRVIQRAVEAMPSSDTDPRALLATAEGDDHTLGLSLVELCLREAGWRTIWSGRRTPSAALVELVEAGGIELLALSASVASSDARGLAEQAGELGRACRKAEVLLVIGGGGAWPEQPAYGTRVRDLAALHGLASTWRAAAARRVG